MGHGSPLVYESNIHIPLIISKPGQQSRVDVYELTNTVDIVPTLLEVTGHPIPKNIEGQVLPGFRENAEEDRIIYSMNTAGSNAFSPMQIASIAMLQGDYKLIEYIGHNDLEKSYELYNLRKDPEEMEDLSLSHVDVAKNMRTILKSKIEQQ